MQDFVKKNTIGVILVFFVELLILVAAFVIKQLGFFQNILVDILILAITILLFLNWIYVIVILLKVSHAKMKTDVNAIDVIGEDIQSVYDFGQIGLILTDSDHNVIWTNEFFPSAQSTLIDMNIFDWNNELAKLLNNSDDSDANVIIDVDNRKFKVSYKRLTSMFILKDVTECENANKFTYEHSPVLGIIAMDNYSDIATIVDDLTLNDMVAKIQAIIGSYCEKYNLCFKKFRQDSFLILGEQNSYEKLVNDKFSIIQKVKDEVNANGYKFTLSIGFALGFHDFNKLSDMANVALDVALSRGGDQAVISPYGKNFIFYGGKSESKSKRNLSGLRVLSKSLSACIEKSDDVYIMGHRNADMDAIGSSLGLYIFASSYIPENKVHIVYDEFNVDNKTRDAIKGIFKDDLKSMVVTSSDAIKSFRKNSLLILTDVHKPSMCMSSDLVNKAMRIAVIDHHRRGEEYVNKPEFAYIESSASSASEIITEFIRYNALRIEVPSRVATCMLAGILLDTNHYRQSTSSTTYDASMLLKDYGADNQIADNCLKADYNEYALKTKIMANSKVPYTGIVVSFGEEDDIIDRTVLAIVAGETLEIQGIKACFVIGRVEENKIGISARSDGTINCQMLMEKMNGGGHFRSAATQIINTTIEDTYKNLLDVFSQYLQDATSSVAKEE